MSRSLEVGLNPERAHPRSKPALTPHTPDADTPPGRGRIVKPIMSTGHDTKQPNRRRNEGGQTRQIEIATEVLTPLTRERGEDSPTRSGPRAARGQKRVCSY